MIWRMSSVIAWKSSYPREGPLLLTKQASRETPHVERSAGVSAPTCLPCRRVPLSDGVCILIGLHSLARLHNVLSLLCRLAALPQSVSSLTRLQVLALSHNVIAELPVGLGCLINLKRLDLRSNRLHVLPEELGGASSLQELDASQNALEQLPKSLAQLKLLRMLLLDKNRWVNAGKTLQAPSHRALVECRPENRLY